MNQSINNMWQPIETFPKDYHKAVLVYCARYKNTYAAHLTSYSGWTHFAAGNVKMTEVPTHWMHLPEAPVIFDWENLWKILPPWIRWVAMDENKSWYGYSVKPDIDDEEENYSTMWGEELDPEDTHSIPADYAPPTAIDWKTSLVKRP